MVAMIDRRRATKDNTNDSFADFRVTPGSIYYLKDPMNPEKKHYYFVLGCGDAIDPFSMVQAVVVTSNCKEKTSEWNIPICINDLKSYIYPLNIISFRREAISPRYYKGSPFRSLKQTSHLTDLIIEIWEANVYGSPDVIIGARTDLALYRGDFDALYPDLPEYSEVKKSKNEVAQVEVTPASTNLPDPVNEVDLDALVTKIDSAPRFYSSWSNDLIVSALLDLSRVDKTAVVGKSCRYKSFASVDRCMDSLRREAKLRDKKETATVIYCDDLFEIPVNPIFVSGANAVEKEYLTIFKK